MPVLAAKIRMREILKLEELLSYIATNGPQRMVMYGILLTELTWQVLIEEY